MTCRCSSPEIHAQRMIDSMRTSQDHDRQAKDAERERKAAADRIRELQSRTPDPDRFAVDDVAQVGRHLVLKVEYQGCELCSYNRRKVMVFLNVTMRDVLRWRRIDPHFRETGHKTTLPAGQVESPSPAARFPASQQGWTDALAFAAQCAENRS